MQTAKLLPLILLAIATCSPAMGQDTICVYRQQGCQMLDVRNAGEINVQHDTLKVDFGTLSLEVPFDSVYFCNTPTEGMRVGWWGNIDEGTAACYYWPDSTNVPNVELVSDSGQCVSAMAFTDGRTIHRGQPRRVGTKWRYTLGTLTGRRRVHLSHFGAANFEHYTWDGACSYEGREGVNMSRMFAGMPSRTVSNVLDYWHRPRAVTAMPEKPVLGRFDGYCYEQSLVDDSLSIVVYLHRVDNSKVVGDSMELVFNDDYTARDVFEQMTVTGDDDFSIALFGNTICIVEYFEATFDEVLRWLVRFDLDLYKPLFLRDDE